MPMLLFVYGGHIMMLINPTIRTMTFEEALEFGDYHQGLMMDHNCVSYRLSAGTKDNLHILESGPVLYVITLNMHMEYVSLDIYMPNEEEPIDNIFLQGESTKEMIGNDWKSLSLIQLVTRLVKLFS
jgi:hypothetical protein